MKANLSITAFSVAVVAFALAFTISAHPTQPVAGTPSSLSPTELAERALVEFEQSLKKYPPIAPGMPDPHKPPKSPQPSKENPKEQ